MVYEDAVVGFIGCGEIAQSIIKGLLKSGVIPASRMKASTSSPATSFKATNLSIEYASNTEIKETCNVIILCVRPGDIISALQDIPSTTAIISTAAGITLESMESAISYHTQQPQVTNVIRTMPSVAATQCSSLTGVAHNPYVSPWTLGVCKWLFEAVGTIIVVNESLIGNIIASSGSSICLFIYIAASLSKAVTAEGFPGDVAIRACTDTMMNAAKLLIENNYDADGIVKSIKVPNGTTEAGLNVLENEGLYELILKSANAMIDQNKKMSKLATNSN